MKIISCLRFELDAIFKDDAGYFLRITKVNIYNISPKVFGKPLHPSSNNREYHPQDSFWRRFSGYNLSRKPCLRNLQKITSIIY